MIIFTLFIVNNIKIQIFIKLVEQLNKSLEDLAIDLIYKKHLLCDDDDVECFDTFIEQKLDDDIIYLEELYQKEKSSEKGKK